MKILVEQLVSQEVPKAQRRGWRRRRARPCQMLTNLRVIDYSVEIVTVYFHLLRHFLAEKGLKAGRLTRQVARRQRGPIESNRVIPLHSSMLYIFLQYCWKKQWEFGCKNVPLWRIQVEEPTHLARISRLLPIPENSQSTATKAAFGKSSRMTGTTLATLCLVTMTSRNAMVTYLGS